MTFVVLIPVFFSAVSETSGCGVKRKFDEMENMSSQSEPMKISLSQLQARHQKHGKPANHVKSSAVVFPESRDRQLSREFAEQFHESVLQTTRQKEIASRLGNSRLHWYIITSIGQVLLIQGGRVA